jgi:hypothetical protein
MKNLELEGGNENKILSVPKREAMMAYSDTDVMFWAFLIFK